MVKMIESGTNAGCYTATSEEYKAIDALLLSLGIRSRVVMWYGDEITFQAENVYKACGGNVTRANELMQPEEIARYKL